MSESAIAANTAEAEATIARGGIAETSKSLEEARALVDRMDKSVAKRVPLTDEDRVEIAGTVEAQMSSLKKIDYWGEDDSAISKQISQIFDNSAKRRAEVDSITSTFSQKNFVGRESSLSMKSINDLREAIAENDPANFKLTTPERLLGFIPMPGMLKKRVANYANKFKTAEVHINEIMTAVLESRDNAIRAEEEIGTVETKLRRLAKGLKKQHEVFKEMTSKVDEFIGELEKDDPQTAAKIRKEVMNRMLEEHRDTLTALNSGLVGITQMGVLKETQRMLIINADRMATTGRLILTISQTIAVAADEQIQMAEMLDKVNGTINDLQTGTAENVKNHAKAMREMSSNPIAAIEALTSAYADTFAALDEVEKYQDEAGKKAKDSIAAMESLASRAEDKAATKGAALKAFAGIVNTVQDRVDAANAESSADSKGPSSTGPR